MNTTLVEYFRCPDLNGTLQLSGPLSDQPGYFKWGEGTYCYARSAAGSRSRNIEGKQYDVSADVIVEQHCVRLPFDSDEVIQNLLYERYMTPLHVDGGFTDSAVRKAYYFVRPLLPVPVRKHLQRLKLRDWDRFSFPEWPVDTTVERIQRRLLALSMKARGLSELPFIWFWPENHPACVLITHDVEAIKGRDFCGQMMDIDASYGFAGSYQVVPEERYPVPASYLKQIVDRGCEVNVHDLNHDGRLVLDPDEFLRRAKKINDYGRQFQAVGFRSGAMYRNVDWFKKLDFEYDLSFPNVGHLEAQRGGCCTVMPFFLGDVVELPLTTCQDYSMFQMLNDYSITRWQQQIEILLANHGLITILVHPDYIIEKRARNCYKSLLHYLAELRDSKGLWSPLPKEAAAWWKQRSQMKLVADGSSWKVEGEGKERASIATARLTGDTITYSLNNSSALQAK